MTRKRHKKLTCERKASLITLGVLLLIIGFSGYLLISFNLNTTSPEIDIKDQVSIIDTPGAPKPSATLTHNITIDATATGVGANNWTWAVSQAWCSGSGTYGDPYLIDSQNIYLNNSNTACINISNSHDVYFTISNLIVRNNATDYGIGIALDNCYDGIIDVVTASSNGDDGIYCLNCRNITIINTTMNSNTHYGLNMDNTTISTMTTCTMNLNTLGGAILINSTYNLFQTTCNFNNNSYGLVFSDSDSNNVTSCNFYNNSQWAFEILNSDSSIITTNDIEDNPLGIYIYDETGDSQSNEIYGNDFDTNTNHAEDNSTGSGNIWDNGVDSGNEWDDYPGADLDDDGIGDDPYDINGAAGAQDRYPIWDDGDSIAPVIVIITPTPSQVFLTIPAFTVTITEAVAIHARWYTIDSGAHNTSFSGTSGVITKTDWDRIIGPLYTYQDITLTFYANDTTGNEGTASVSITKYFAAPPHHGEDDDTVYTYTLTKNLIFILSGFAFALSLGLYVSILKSKRRYI